MTIGYLMRDRQERFVNLRQGGTRAWYVNAWRIVDAQGTDIIQPWSDSKAEAYATAKQCGIEIQGEVQS